MTGTFGTVIIIIVTGLVVGLVIPMMVSLILREIEGYQMRKANQVTKQWTELMTMFGNNLERLGNKIQEMTTNGKKSV